MSHERIRVTVIQSTEVSATSVTGFSFVVPALYDSDSWQVFQKKIRTKFTVKEPQEILLTSIDTEEAVECIEDIFDGQQLFLTVFDHQSDSEPDDTEDALEEENEEEKDAAHRSSFCMFLPALKSQKQHLRSEAFISLASAVDSFSVSIENQLAMLSSPSLCLRICSAALPSSSLSSG